jgi:hypothetical protein
VVGSIPILWDFCSGFLSLFNAVVFKVADRCRSGSKYKKPDNSARAYIYGLFITGRVHILAVSSDLAMIASYVINPSLRQHNLDYLAQRYLNHKMISYHEVVGKGKAEITLKLMRILDRQLKEDMNQDLFYNLEMKLLPVLMDMETAGIKIDVSFFKEMSLKFAREIMGMQEKYINRREWNSTSIPLSNWVLCCLKSSSFHHRRRPPRENPTQRMSKS